MKVTINNIYAVRILVFTVGSQKFPPKSVLFSPQIGKFVGLSAFYLFLVVQYAQW